MKLSDVSYITDDPAIEYTKGIDRCKTLEELKYFLSEWEGLADDALKVIKDWREKDFKKFQKNLKKERAGEFCGDTSISPILMPYLMFKASVLSSEYGCPWGTAVKRLTHFQGKI